MYSEDGLLGCTHSVEEQATNIRPATASVHKKRMKSSCFELQWRHIKPSDNRRQAALGWLFFLWKFKTSRSPHRAGHKSQPCVPTQTYDCAPQPALLE